MKKNKMMRIASFLLVAVLMSTCAISGTFAKYVTADTATDSARVAKWGVTIDISSYKAFEKSYQNPEGTATTVQADVKVVAPGTTGTLVNSTISGTPEVSVNVSFAATLTLEGWTLANGEEYCPIVFKVGSETYSLAGMGGNQPSANIADLKSAVERAINAYSQDYGVGTNLTTAAAPVVTWTWAIQTGSDQSTKDANDAKDTYLGDKAPAPTISLQIVTTVTQIDD